MISVNRVTDCSHAPRSCSATAEPVSSRCFWTSPRSATDLGRFVSRVRRHRGITQEALAADLGITRQYVSELENGAENLYVRRLFEIFDELGIDVRLEERP